MSEDADSFLQAASSEGRLDSTGRFTIDEADMLEKLARFQLPQPGFYILKLVQAAISGGCSILRIDDAGWGSRLELRYDGTPYSMEQLTNLPNFLLDYPAHQRHLHHLAVGMSSARSTGAKTWTVQSQEGGLSLDEDGRLRWTSGQFKENLIVLEWPRSSRNIAELAGQIASHLDVRLAGLFSPEAAALTTRAVFAPVPILLNGHGLNRHPGIRFQGTSTIHPGLRGNPLRLELGADSELDGFCFFVSNSGRSEQIIGPSQFKGKGLVWWAGGLLNQTSWFRVRQSVAPAPLGLGRPTCTVHFPDMELPHLYYAGKPCLGCDAAIQICPRTSAGVATLWLVQDGVTWEVENPEGLDIGHKYWASAAHLQADLSQFRAIKNQAYQDLVDSLRALRKSSWG